VAENPSVVKVPGTGTTKVGEKPLVEPLE